MKTMIKLKAVALVSIGTLLTQYCQAALVTSSPGGTVIDFSQFGVFSFTPGPVQVGGLVGADVKWSSTYALSVIGNGGYGLSSNGFWDSGRNGYVGLNSPSGSMSFTFANPVSFVGAFMNYAPGNGTPIISIYDSANNLIETANLSILAPISTLGAQNAGAFRGFTIGSASIARFELSGGFDVADDLTFSFSAVPEPSTCVAGALLLLPFGAQAIRRSRASRQVS